MFLSLMCKVEREKKKKNSGKLKTQKCKRRYFFLAEGKGLGSTSFWVEERMCTPCSQKKKMYRKGFGPVGKKKKTQEKEGDVLTYALGYILGRNFTFLLPSPLPLFPSWCSHQERKKEELEAERIVTWLILPVVICLSQRLSHACLSINCLYCETANGSLNQL